MLVYANHLAVRGHVAEEVIFRVVGVWLKEQLGFGLHPERLKRDGNIDGKDRTWVQIRVAIGEDPRFFSWVVKKGDSEVGGRQWRTELGMKSSDDETELSCVVRTDDQSTLITEEHAVSASQPRLIRYTVRDVLQASNCDFLPAVPGVKVKSVGTDERSYKGLLATIERPDRDYPLVLMSPKDRERYLLEPERLQERLFGLAQVVKVDFEYNSYDMADVLGNHWAAWDGALNVIQTPNSTGFIRGRVFLSQEIEAWGGHEERLSRVLAWVTHNTNIPRLRKRIRPDGVTRLAIRQQMAHTVSRLEKLSVEELRSQLQKNAEMEKEHDEYVQAFDAENEELKEQVANLSAENTDMKDELGKRGFEIQGLKNQLGAAYSGQKHEASDLEWVFEVVGKAILPAQCLDLIARVYGDKCVVLDSARASAAESVRFSQGKRLLYLLRTLVTTYRVTLMREGDAKARACFSSGEFAATESEVLTSNPELRRERTFAYENQQVEMFAHLKIGVADDTSKTIRVHFFWDAPKEKIVIGYCGPHLRVLGKS